MGEATADTRRQIDETREALTGTLHELRVRGRRARQVGMRVAVSAAAAGALAGAAVTAAVIVVRRRDAGPLTRGSKRLWRRTVLRVAEAGATAAATAVVQQVLNRRLPVDRHSAGESMEVRDSPSAGVAAG